MGGTQTFPPRMTAVSLSLARGFGGQLLVLLEEMLLVMDMRLLVLVVVVVRVKRNVRLERAMRMWRVKGMNVPARTGG